MNEVLGRILVAAAPSNDAVTPGWVGFLVTFLVAVATVLLIIDMTRRIRRVRYRSEIRQRLENENPDQDGTAPTGKTRP